MDPQQSKKEVKQQTNEKKENQQNKEKKNENKDKVKEAKKPVNDKNDKDLLGKTPLNDNKSKIDFENFKQTWSKLNSDKYEKYKFLISVISQKSRSNLIKVKSSI